MKEEIETKWEWVGRRSKSRGYVEAARLAEKIDIVLKKIYGNTITNTWRRDYTFNHMESTDQSDSDIWDVITDTHYCIACASIGTPTCKGCRFAEETGYCDQDGSLYDLFCTAFGDKV